MKHTGNEIDSRKKRANRSQPFQESGVPQTEVMAGTAAEFATRVP